MVFKFNLLIIRSILLIFLLAIILYACKGIHEENGESNMNSWYANPPQDAGSSQNLAYPRLVHHGKIKGENGKWEDEVLKGK